MEKNPIDQIAQDFSIPRHLRKIVLMLVEDALRMNQELLRMRDDLDELRDMVYPIEPPL